MFVLALPVVRDVVQVSEIEHVALGFSLLPVYLQVELVRLGLLVQCQVFVVPRLALWIEMLSILQGVLARPLASVVLLSVTYLVPVVCQVPFVVCQEVTRLSLLVLVLLHHAVADRLLVQHL